MSPSIERQRVLRCPDWCVINHDGELSRDTDEQVTHQGEPGPLGLFVMRVDCPAERRIGNPVLYVSVEEEVTTWKEAVLLQRAISQGFERLYEAKGEVEG